MKRLLFILFCGLPFCAALLLAQTNVFPTRWLPHRTYSYIDDVQRGANIDREAVVSSPSWEPSKPLPLSFTKAEQVARSELRRIVSDEPSWEVTKFGLWRVRETSPQSWYYEVRLSPATRRREYSTNSYPDDFAVLIDFSGKPGSLRRIQPE